jgi:hypothetical protein
LLERAIRLAGGQLQACPALDPRDRSEPGASPGAVVVSLDTYIEAAGIPDGGRAPLPLRGRTGVLTEKPTNRVDVWRMTQRRAADLGTLSNWVAKRVSP